MHKCTNEDHFVWLNSHHNFSWKYIFVVFKRSAGDSGEWLLSKCLNEAYPPVYKASWSCEITFIFRNKGEKLNQLENR